MADEQVPVLDVRGEICPYPMLKTNEMLDGNQKGVQILDVLTDHPPALSTVPPQAMKRGYEVEIDELSAGEWRLRLSKM
jgi:tRNA 2-thiouridine synthesizing protein A